MRVYVLIVVVLGGLVGCGSTDTGSTTGDPSASCPEAGCENASCDDLSEGDMCLGFDAAKERGWVGFCIVGVCTEYVPVRCSITQPPMMVSGCDGSGTVTGGMEIQFDYHGGPDGCSGVEGEFGYCAPGEACFVYQDGALVGQGVCK